MNAKKIVEEVTIELLRQAACELPQDVLEALENAYQVEEKELAKIQLSTIIENVKKAKQKNLPLCQDTGIHIYYVELGEDVEWIKGVELKEVLISASKKATKIVPMRPNAVNPFTLENSGDNTGKDIPFINWEIVKGDRIKITVFPKGGGSENMCALCMLTPGEGIKGLKKSVIDTIVKAGGKPCPPLIIGIGIGGGADIALKTAKKQLLRNIGQRHPEKEIAKLEEELKKAINMFGIGPLGLGGKTTCLDVFIDYTYRHPATFPVGIAIQCWAARSSSAVIYSNGNVEFLRK